MNSQEEEKKKHRTSLQTQLLPSQRPILRPRARKSRILQSGDSQSLTSAVIDDTSANFLAIEGYGRRLGLDTENSDVGEGVGVLVETSTGGV